MKPGTCFACLALLLVPVVCCAGGNLDVVADSARIAASGPATATAARDSGGMGPKKQKAAADTAAADTAAARAAQRDSAAGVRVDSLSGWRSWRDISRAIALKPLDGPEDILEKREIIQDRLDRLAVVDRHLTAVAGRWRSRDKALTAQLEVLEDLSEVRFGGDLQLDQRIQRVRSNLEDIRASTRRVNAETGQLHVEVKRLQRLAGEYLHKANQLRRQEERNR